ncbi:YihA family ribosome biogenesis GTP-binding protein [Rhodobacteraceae bacterium RKSG542]|uniref:ribosome biogenesis GTP-binding protein YihA/YsxC n=1 Tax=Pseudovibrio flavus TaxID=2529854 RepID=UPI0012BD52C2|nr:ribosome biogenesis GTP-binding protein YihA/YsxC [Pseudovibrio flavus]MTI17154.1 YihA family ribosome biogenesis GTP-binding protein [Pseudovibrio flavus]
MTQEKERTEEELEAGRLLFAREWYFVTSVKEMRQLPPLGPLEIAFAGRSNVGKSSLINALTNRNALAKTSNTPGRTQMLNFFYADESPVAICDMPGYGYAEAPKGMVDAWTKLIFQYLRGRSTLRRVFTLIDSRHGIKKNDIEAMSILDKAAVPYQVVLTKADKIKASELEKVKADTLQLLSKRPAAYPEIIVTSSEKGWGLDELRAEILTLTSNG